MWLRMRRTRTTITRNAISWPLLSHAETNRRIPTSTCSLSISLSLSHWKKEQERAQKKRKGSQQTQTRLTVMEEERKEQGKLRIKHFDQRCMPVYMLPFTPSDKQTPSHYTSGHKSLLCKDKQMTCCLLYASPAPTIPPKPARKCKTITTRTSAVYMSNSHALQTPPQSL